MSSSLRPSDDGAGESTVRKGDIVEEKQQLSPLVSPSRQLRLLSPRGVMHSSRTSAMKGASSASSSPNTGGAMFDWPTFSSSSSSSSTPFASRPVTAAPSQQTSRKQSQITRPATALHTKPYPSSNELSHRDILRTTTTRRAYTASPHRIPFLPSTPPSPLPCPPFQSPAPASFASSIRGPNFFLSSEQNKSDDFLAWMKAMSGNYSTTNGSDDNNGSEARSSSRHSHAPLISRQYAFNSQNHRTELVLNDQIAALSAASSSSSSPSSMLSGSGTVLSTSFLPPSSSLCSRGGYISHAPSARFQLPLPHGQSLASSFTPNYYQYAAFIPVCERGPAYAFGTGRRGDDELEVKRKRLMEEKTVQKEKEKEKSRRRKEREEREAELQDGEEKEQDCRRDGDDDFEQPPVDHIRHNITTTAVDSTVASRLRRQSLLAEEERQKRQSAESARHSLLAERTERHQIMLRRHDPAWRAQRRQQQEEAEKTRVLQRSWLLLITVASRVEVWRRSVEHYQKVMQSERAVRVIVQWLRRCRERKRKQRFLHARRNIRLFWEERLAILYLHDNEADKRRAMDVVLTFLSWATSKRKQEVVRAFGTIESKVVKIQRAWRQYATVQRWRLTIQVIQFVQFNPDTYGKEKERVEDAQTDRLHSPPASTSTLTARPSSSSSSSHPPPRPSSRSALRSSTAGGLTSNIPRQRIRYFRFLPPTFKSTSPNIQPETSHMGTGGLQRWNAMIRMQREVFIERLNDEVRLQYQRSQRRKMEEARDELNRLASPRAGGGGVLSPRHRMLQPTVCNVEWPQMAGGGSGRLRHWLLTNLQLHEMHRRALKACAVVSVGSSGQVERLYVTERTVKYVRRRPVDQREEGSDDRRLNSAVEPGITSWATVKRWEQSLIIHEIDEEEVERKIREDEIRKSRERANSIVGVGDGDLSSLARFQLQLKQQNGTHESTADSSD